MNELQAGIEFAFAVLPQSSALFQPSEAALDNPAFRQHDKRMQFVALDHLHRGLQPLHHAVGKGFARVAAIDQHALHRLQIRLAPVHGSQSAATVRDIGRGHGDGVGQALRVHRNMSLDAGNLFAGIVSFLFCRVGVLDALRVNNNEAGRGLAPQFLAGLANRFFLRRAPRRLFPADQVLSTWRNTNTRYTTWESPREAYAIGSRS